MRFFKKPDGLIRSSKSQRPGHTEHGGDGGTKVFSRGCHERKYIEEEELCQK
jgi:hypothetical protein